MKKPCITPGCGKPKVAGRGKRYCEGCKDKALEIARITNRQRLDEWEKRNPERAREVRRRYRRRRDVRDGVNARRRAARNADPETYRSTWLMDRYNITADQYDALLEAQGHRCALCGRHASEQKRRLHVDHDHNCCPTIGKCCGLCIRGLLCVGCNQLLGWYERRRADIETYTKQRILTWAS